MGKINVLPFAVANLIAAGEVVDRPASVIKELTENSIDAGADRITVEIQNGGVSFMRVSDNGCGISPEDLPVAIKRHATSKILDAGDLESIITLGFRGEALAAISSVSDIRIITKTKDAPVGCMLSAASGEEVEITERACSDGTTVIVENLFGNVPARRKFLKKHTTEAMAVNAIVEKLALSHPETSVKLIIDGVTKLETAGDGNTKSVIYALFGKSFTSALINIDGRSDGITVRGYIGRPENVRANRNFQNFFINGRYIKSKTATAALEQAYTSYIAPEKFPPCVIYIETDPAVVDINVHPTKLEVRFTDEKAVFEAIYYTVRAALEKNCARPTLGIDTSRISADEAAKLFSGSGATDFSALEAKKAPGYDKKPGRLSEAFVPIEDRRTDKDKAKQITIDTPGITSQKATIAIATATATAATTASKTQEQERKMKTQQSSVLTAEGYIAEYIKTDGFKKSADYNDNENENKDKQTASEGIRAEAPTQRAVQENAEEHDDMIPQERRQKKNGEQKEPQTEAFTDKASETDKEKPYYRIIGEAFNYYVIVETENKLLLIDKHAAHERIIFEQFKARMANRGEGASRLLMFPVEIMMTSAEVALICEYRNEIEAVGYSFTSGKYTVNITAIPENIDPDATEEIFETFAARLSEGTGSVGITKDIIFEKALYQASCKAAIKGGREYPPEYIEWLVGKMMLLPDITVCPHGRPVALELPKRKLDHQFGRI